MKQWIILSFSLISFSNLSITNAQSSGNVQIEGKEVTTVDLKADEYTLNFPVQSEKKPKLLSKLAGFLNKDLGYTISVNALDNKACPDEKNFFYYDGTARATNLQSLAKSNKPLISKMDGQDFHYSLKRYLDRCPCKTLDLELVLYTDPTADKIISTIPLKVSANVMAANKEEEKASLIKYFKSGIASRTIHDSKAEKLIESYMENKWTVNITTVHLTDMHYTNTTQTELRIDGFYIEHEDGICLYNSFYCDTKKGTNSQFNITFFNSMDAPKEMDCEIATQFQNM